MVAERWSLGESQFIVARTHSLSGNNDLARSIIDPLVGYRYGLYDEINS